MKKQNTFKLILSFFLALTLLIPCAWAAFFYTRPMEEESYDLSLLPANGQAWEGNKGWTVFTEESGRRKELLANGAGGYTGIEDGVTTFYFSRKLKERLDNPTLQLYPVDRTISIFLDDALIYTDCPELDNRIGKLSLPMLEYDRTEPVTVSLPLDYEGRILTIAQSVPSFAFSENPGSPSTVFPCDVRLYCGYSYESSLIAQTAQTIIPAILLFALILFLLFTFVHNAVMGNFYLSLPVFAITVFFHMCSVLVRADFFSRYFQTFALDFISLFFYMSIAAFFAFLTLYAEKLKWLYMLFTVIQTLAAVIGAALQIKSFLPYGDLYLFFTNLPSVTGFFCLIAVVFLSFYLCRKKNDFFCRFTKGILLFFGGYAVFLSASVWILPEYASDVRKGISGDLTAHMPNRSLKLLFALCLLSGIYAVITSLISREAEKHAEQAVLAEKSRLALESYKNLRFQSEELQMLRHDTVKHYSLLQKAVLEAPEKISSYLEELIGKAKEIRPVVSSGNKILDIILNGKLNMAQEKGISVKILRSEAPENLPVSDAEACSLFMNILDNAISAASESGFPDSYICLDFHCKEHHFVFYCENSALFPEHAEQKNPDSKHGYGLKIIHHIMEKHGNMIHIKRYKKAFSISVILPLS